VSRVPENSDGAHRQGSLADDTEKHAGMLDDEGDALEHDAPKVKHQGSKHTEDEE